MSSVSLSKIGPAKQSRNVCARNRVFSCHVVSHSRFLRTTAAFDDVDVFPGAGFWTTCRCRRPYGKIVGDAG